MTYCTWMKWFIHISLFLPDVFDIICKYIFLLCIHSKQPPFGHCLCNIVLLMMMLVGDMKGKLVTQEDNILKFVRDKIVVLFVTDVSFLVHDHDRTRMYVECMFLKSLVKTLLFVLLVKLFFWCISAKER